MNRHIFKLVFVIVMLVGFKTVLAESQTINFDTGKGQAELPSYDSSEFPRIAKVGLIDHDNRVIVLGDVRYRIAADAWVRTPTNVRDTISRLSLGNKVAFQPLKEDGRRLVKKFHLLP